MPVIQDSALARKAAAIGAVNINDLRTLAKKRLPRGVFDFLDGAAEDEVTLNANRTAFQAITFRPRQALEIAECDLRTRVLGSDLSMPVILAPVGCSRVMHHEGETGVARAAGDADTLYILSTSSGHKLEDVRAAGSGPLWYQLYLLGGRGPSEAVIDRAQQVGYSALVLTIDTAVAGLRERDIRNRLVDLAGKNLIKKIPLLPNLLMHPRWLVGFLRDGGAPTLPNVIIPGQGPLPLLNVGKALSKSVVTWKDFEWIRQIWRGPIVVKGVLTSEDARRSVDMGAAAVVVSNHGGRQLDGVPASLDVLPEVLEAVGSQAEVLIDGGIRRGGDVVKALCLGARAVLIGRGYAYGLAAAGTAGVARALQIFREDIVRTLKLMGCDSVKGLDRSYLNYKPR